jgi:PIN domain nuclease of toxin-antitoxin system
LTALLLDTHVLVWLMDGNERLGGKSRHAIQAAAQSEGVYVSAITPWEIAMLVSKGRLVMKQDIGEWVQAALSQPGIRLEPLSPEVAVASTRLPGDFHPDPADRIIAATARHLEAALVTADARLLAYGQAGYMKTLPAEQ